MITLILSTHILVSLVLSGSMVGVLTSAYGRHATKLYQTMMLSFASVVASGVALLVVSPAGLGRFCVMMSAFTLATLAVRAFYRRRVAQTAQ